MSVPEIARERRVRSGRPGFGLGTRALATALAAVLLISPGCLTMALWEGFEWRASYPVEIESPDLEGPPTYQIYTETHYLDCAARVALTPFTLAADIVTIYVWIWWYEEIFHHHHH